jgi:hypothetical protein
MTGTQGILLLCTLWYTEVRLLMGKISQIVAATAVVREEFQRVWAICGLNVACPL